MNTKVLQGSLHEVAKAYGFGEVLSLLVFFCLFFFGPW
jgi:hypothetical protein